MSSASQSSPRILLVDDEPPVLEAQSALLELEGYTNVARATSVAAAKERLTAGPAALVVLDLKLGDESGQELLD